MGMTPVGARMTSAPRAWPLIPPRRARTTWWGWTCECRRVPVLAATGRCDPVSGTFLLCSHLLGARTGLRSGGGPGLGGCRRAVRAGREGGRRGCCDTSGGAGHQRLKAHSPVGGAAEPGALDSPWTHTLGGAFCHPSPHGVAAAPIPSPALGWRLGCVTSSSFCGQLLARVSLPQVFRVCFDFGEPSIPITRGCLSLDGSRQPAGNRESRWEGGWRREDWAPAQKT